MKHSSIGNCLQQWNTGSGQHHEENKNTGQVGRDCIFNPLKP